MSIETLLSSDIGFALFGTLLLILSLYLIVRSRRQRAREAAALSKVAAEHALSDSAELAEEARKRVFPDLDPGVVHALFKRFNFKFSKSGDFGIQPDQEILDILMKKNFPTEQVAPVGLELERYGAKKYELDPIGMRLHIIHLSGGDVTRIPGLVDRAKLDYRDIVMESASPNVTARLKSAMQSPKALQAEALRKAIDLSSPEVKKAQDADLRQFGMWLLPALQP